MRSVSVLAILWALAGLVPSASVVAVVQAADPAGFRTLQIGDPAPDFSLPAVDGKTYALGDFADRRLLLVIFTCNHCPTAQAYEERLAALHADYRDKGVAVVAISPNDDRAVRLDELGYTDVGDSFEDMKLRADERGFAFPYLYDGETQKVSLAYGAVATPHVFLFDQDRKLRYSGRIDDGEVKPPTSQDARNALDALLAGKPVPVERTRTFGCSTKWSDKRKDAVAYLEKADQEPVELQTIDEAGLKALVRNETDKLLLINVWASWCGPCVTELPEFVTMNRMYRRRDFQMVTISMDELDQREDALKVLKEKRVAVTNYIADVADRDRLAEAIDGEWSGPVPYTILVAPGGKVLYRESNAVDSLKLRRRIVDFLGRTYAKRGNK